jgi:hypothetical protein
LEVVNPYYSLLFKRRVFLRKVLKGYDKGRKVMGTMVKYRAKKVLGEKPPCKHFEIKKIK